MFFYLHFAFSTNKPGLEIFRIRDKEQLPPLEGRVLYVKEGVQRLEKIPTTAGTLILLGDPIIPEQQLSQGQLIGRRGRVNEAYLYEAVRGHYYWFHVQAAEIYCGASFGSIFPLYYQVLQSGIAVSSSSFALAEKTNATAGNKRNLLERLLFHYPFFNSTWWVDIQLLEAHHFLHLSAGGYHIGGDFELSHYFSSPERRSPNDLARLVDLFEEEACIFFPQEEFAISLTGGFDGRTLAAAARSAGRPFLAYSFGREDAPDVTIPALQASRLGFPYTPIYLGEEYLEKEALNAALAFMRLTEYNGNLGRPHYQYAARVLSRKVRFILTGNFGSELFRALHQPGVMMSDCLLQIFASRDDSWKGQLRQSVDSWGRAFFRDDTDALIADLENYLGRRAGWPLNHRFYDFVFNELFRKYFGPELLMQSYYLNNRTPYLSFRFFKELSRTIWSGLHSGLFEQNKFRRMKGQMFYSAFMKKADSRLYALPTSKGYCPADVLEYQRLPLLAAKLLWRKLFGAQEGDSHSVEAFFRSCRQDIFKELGASIGPAFLKKQIVDSFAPLPQGVNIEQLVKLYSVGLGWTAVQAGLLSQQPGQLLQREPENLI